MKILMVNKFLYPCGGSETYMIKLGQYLQLIGHEVQYFGMLDEKNIVGNECNAFVSNVDFHATKLSIFNKIKLGVESIYSFKARSEIQRVLEKFRPDVIHMNNINFQITPSIIYEIKKKNIPIIQTVHDVQIACPCHRFYIEHTEQICEKCQKGRYIYCIKNKCIQNSIFKSGLAMIESYYYHMRNTYNLVDTYICPSKFIGDKIVSAGVEKVRIKIMYNYAENSSKNIPHIKQEKYALYFGRFSKEKGIIGLLDVFSVLPDIRLIIAGKGPLEEYVKSRVEKIPNVEYVGFKTGQELKELISSATFSIYPSEWYENCPLSVIESQSLGTPVIGSDLGGTKELICNEKTGLVYSGRNTESLKEAVQRLWNEEKLVKNMSIQCMNNSYVTIEGYADNLLNIYRRLIQVKGKENNA